MVSVKRNFSTMIFWLGMTMITGLIYGQKRCDFLPRATPGAGGASTCLDLIALKTSGASLQTAQNATRISRDGFTFCKNAFQISSGAEADITFIYDNSGSMKATNVWINPTTKDTIFYTAIGDCLDVSGVPFTYQTLEGPRTVNRLNNNAGCSQRAGDPYNARGIAIREGVNALALASPTSTASALGFSSGPTGLAHLRPPLQLNTPENISLVTKSIVLDTEDLGTHYGPPLRQATLWLNDAALIRTTKPAIVFISDGAPTDLDYAKSIPSGIPIFSIFMGDATTDYAKLQDLSTRTQGTFYLVPPNDVKRMSGVIKEIIAAITITTEPRSMEITNLTLNPKQVSHSTSIVRTGADSSFSVVLDSILALKQGMNEILVKLVKGDSLTDNYTIKVQSDGPAMSQSSASLACYDQPSLAMLSAANQVEEIYSASSLSYNIRLTRSPSELIGTPVSAIYQDGIATMAIDSESIFLPSIQNTAGLATNQRNDFPFSVTSTLPGKNNGILEAGANGKVVLTWSHPRDAREKAVFQITAKQIPIKPGFIAVERVRSVPKGMDITEPIDNPIVISGGAVLTRINNDSAMLTTKGCIYNCTDRAIRLSDPYKTPSFVFKTAAPFSFELHLFNNLGQFILKSKGTVSATEWESMPKIGDSVAVAMSIIPVTDKGQPLATGAYILDAKITTMEMTANSQGSPSRIAAAKRFFYNKFGYIRAPQP